MSDGQLIEIEDFDKKESYSGFVQMNGDIVVLTFFTFLGRKTIRVHKEKVLMLCDTLKRIISNGA